MNNSHEAHAKAQTGHGSFASYSIGFVLSIALTMAAYLLVVNDTLSGWNLAYVLIALAIVQLFVQLVFFLHLGRESKPRWNLMAFLFMVLVVFIVAFGSIWIMRNLDYNMTGHDVDQYIQEQSEGGF